MLRKPELDEPKRAWSLDVIERQVAQLSRLVDDLLDVSRITRGKIELKLESIDLERVVSTAVETCQPLIQSLNHQLKIRHPTEAPFIHGTSPD
jgi:K+-sensing histidine kinase KdpD